MRYAGARRGSGGLIGIGAGNRALAGARRPVRSLRGGLSLGRPARLGVDAGDARPGAPAPWALEEAGGAAEVGDDPAGAAAGHTLPRLMGLAGLILLVGCVARHEAMRLAFAP